MKIRIGDIIKSINPNAEYTVIGNNLPINQCKIEWHNGTQPIPANEILAKEQELIAEYNASQYQRDRAKEYPDFREYLDGIVKGNQAQIDKYIADCLAIKTKYPKE